ncbi:MAG: caspase family protein [Planctomycetaceae bacterium]
MRFGIWGIVPLLPFVIAINPAQAEGRKLAVVVGVDVYRANAHLPPLRYAAADASALSEALRNAGYHVIEMTHAVAREPGKELFAPNSAYIRDQIDGILNYPNLGAEDAVLVALSGHGVQ